jgi:precorrin-6y C5,15-methyltransferase (decarboxylating), CbiE subunit/precorrin-6Y C5,15-methyltransferase (decarboxylating), CbiT subunit
MNVFIAGCGMGSPTLLTMEAHAALRHCDVIIGSPRILDSLSTKYQGRIISEAIPDAIAQLIRSHPEWKNVCIAMSGDVGFYSGAKLLMELLADHAPVLLQGISTPQYFASRLRRPWQDFRLVSGHGKECDVLAEVLNHREVLFLTGGGETAESIVAELVQSGLEDAVVSVGEMLSSPAERITVATAAELRDRQFSSPNVVLVDNPKTFSRDVRSPGIPDEEFIRGDVPMTKREVRVQILSQLGLKEDAVVYDIGAGTGSVAVEAALLARRGRVFAFESNSDACSLIEANRIKFGTYNIRVVPGLAPDAFHQLPPPDAAFIGGSRGHMKNIIEALLGKNPTVKIVVSAVTLETLAEALDLFKQFALSGVTVSQIAISHTKEVGTYHMLQALNPVFVLAGGGRDAK